MPTFTNRKQTVKYLKKLGFYKNQPNETELLDDLAYDLERESGIVTPYPLWVKYQRGLGQFLVEDLGTWRRVTPYIPRINGAK
jgi:hypothetical protein